MARRSGGPFAISPDLSPIQPLRTKPTAVLGNHVTLKILLPGYEAPKMINVDKMITVDATCEELVSRLSSGELQATKKRLNVDAAAPGKLTLYKMPTETAPGRWLRPRSTIESEKLGHWDVLELRSRMEKLRFNVSDVGAHEISVDSMVPSGELMVDICSKFDLQFPDEYGFKVVSNRHEHQQSLGSSLRRKSVHGRFQWVNPSHPFKKYRLEEGAEVLIRRRFYFNDNLVNETTPADLNLLYAECRLDVLENDQHHFLGLDEAVCLAGIQCQVIEGDYVNEREGSTRRSSNFLARVLPKKFVKSKGVERMVSREHMKHAGLNEFDAKLAYVNQCRALFPDSYGFTFFVVKERVQGKGKLVNRLLGISNFETTCI
ncbi:hypothetical protein ACOME3_002479 [Neoechinorhynchus agilis]